jgi:hypothetical protein
MAPLPCCGWGHRVGDDFFAAFPILTAIAHWTGKIGTVYIKRLIVKGKINEAKRNAAVIVAAVIGTIFLLILGCIIMLALLPK